MKPTSYRAPAYALIFPRVAELVRPYGYAAAIHGSMANDLDIVLVPWTSWARPADQVVLALYTMIETCFGSTRLKLSGPEPKDHGRRAWTIPLLAGCAIDLSVMPLLGAPRTDEAFYDLRDWVRDDVVALSYEPEAYRRRLLALFAEHELRIGHPTQDRPERALGLGDETLCRCGVGAGGARSHAPTCPYRTHHEALTNLHLYDPDLGTVNESSAKDTDDAPSN